MNTTIQVNLPNSYVDAGEWQIGPLIIKIQRDEYPMSPNEWDTDFTFVSVHRSYSFAERTSFSDMSDAVEHVLYELGTEGEQNKYECTKECNISKILDRETIWLPVYIYDHGGIALRTGTFSCPWDSGQLGFIYIPKAKVREIWNWSRLTKTRVAKIEEYLRGEVESWDKYVKGEVYNFVVEDECGVYVDGCSGFYAENSGEIIDESGIDYHLNERKEKLAERRKIEVRNRVPYEKRTPLPDWYYQTVFEVN